MSRSSQRGSAPGASRFATPPPRDPEVAAPVFAVRVKPAHEDDQADGSSPPHALLPDDLKDATPRKFTISSIDLLHKQKGQYTKLANMEMDHRYIQVSLDAFFDEYMPQPPTQASELSESQLKKSGDFSKVSHSDGETMMYAPLCETFQKLLKATGSSYAVYDTSGRGDLANAWQDTKPDLCLYDGKNGHSKYVLDENERKSSTIKDAKRRKHLGRVAWAWMTSFIEVKGSARYAPFNFDDAADLDVKDTVEGRRSRAQVIKYVTEIQHRQHRTFVLCAFICCDWVRFMRWDRAGAIVSAADNYVQNPLRLLDFIHRISISSRKDQGYDPTVTLVNHNNPDVRKNIDNVKRSLPPKVSLKNVFEESFEGDMDDYPLYKLECEDVPYRAENRAAAQEKPPDGPRTYSYWISKIHAGSRSPTGRGMKGYVAIDIDHQQIVFLKDYWCPNIAGTHPELETYARLRQFSVMYVPTALAGGRVIGDDGRLQTTITQKLLEECREEHFVVPPEAFHYRFVVREVGQRLEEHVSAYHLWFLIGLAIVGHKTAYENAHILHRDISVNNIMINPLDGTPLLIDWDLAKYVDTDTTIDSHQSGRSGTWPFMSAKLLQLPKKPNDLADDLESFIYVLSIMILCYHPHSMSPLKYTPAANSHNEPLAQHINDMFFSNIVSDQYHCGGKFKLLQIKAGSPGFEPKDPHLCVGICELYKLLNRHYQAFPIDVTLQTKWGIPAPSASTLAVPAPGPTPPPLGAGFQLAVSKVPPRRSYLPPSPPTTSTLLPASSMPGSPEASSAPSPEASSAPSPEASSGPPKEDAADYLNTHIDIIPIFFAEKHQSLNNEWVPIYTKTSSQFESLPNPAGPGSGFASSLAGSSAGSSAGSHGSKRRLESEGGDGGDVGDVGDGEDGGDGGDGRGRANKKRKVKGKGSSRAEQGSQPPRRSSRIFDKVAAGNVLL